MDNADNASVSPATTTDGTNHIIRAIIIWAVCTAVALAVFLLLSPHLVDWHVLPPSASDRSGDIDNVLWLFTFLSIPVFFMVVVFAGYSAFNFRRSRGATGLFSPPRRLPLIWVIASFVLVAFLYVYGLTFLNNVSAKPAGAMVVNVTGEQWLWNYSYPRYGNAESTVLELPVGQPVTFNIDSLDVQHSFWIPAFGIKQDAVPGEITSISVTPKTIGTYVVRCAELCGLYHAYMETPVYVVSQADFNTWVTHQPTPVPTQSSSLFHPNAITQETASRANGRSTGLAEG